MAIEDKDAADLSVAPIVGPDDPRRFTDSGIEVAPVYTEADLPEDLVALTVEAAAMARVPLAGTTWVPGAPTT